MREVLYRTVYRGEITWNRTQKRNAWGQVQQRDRRPDEWIRVPAPHLRIVSDTLWEAAHARLDVARQAYLQSTHGRRWGRPIRSIDSSICSRGSRGRASAAARCT